MASALGIPFLIFGDRRVQQQEGVHTVVLGGVTDTGGVALVAAVTAESGKVAGDLIKDAAKAVGGGGGGKGDIATAGGKTPGGARRGIANCS